MVSEKPRLLARWGAPEGASCSLSVPLNSRKPRKKDVVLYEKLADGRASDRSEKQPSF